MTDETLPHFLASCLVRVAQATKAIEWIERAREKERAFEV